MQIWTVHGNGRAPAPGEVVGPAERLTWSRTIGIGAQHIVAMFGSTFLVPALTGFPATTTLFFSGIGTLLFLIITRNRVPSYLGSSFAFIAPVVAAENDGGIAVALGGIVAAGILLAAVGLVVERVGPIWVDRVMPPVVTGTIVALIGFNLAPTAKTNFEQGPVSAMVTLVAVMVFTVALRGFVGRLGILLGVVAGYICAALLGEVDFDPIENAAWIGLPEFQQPTFTVTGIVLIAPVVLVLVAENVGHIKAVAAMTGKSLDDSIGRGLIGDGLATTLAGLGGGSGTTTYAENIGVMAATRIYSTAAYMVAGIAGVLLAMSPKVGAVIASIPAGVLGGATVVLYGLIGTLGARIWITAGVDFSNPVNMISAAVPLVLGIANFTWTFGDVSFSGIALGSFAAVGIYHALRLIAPRSNPS